jgi:hypothetical protein
VSQKTISRWLEDYNALLLSQSLSIATELPDETPEEAKVEQPASASDAHRPSNEQITCWAQTEQGRVEVTHWANGDAEVMRYTVRSGSVQIPGATLLRGNVNEGVFWPPASHITKPD